VLQSGIIDKNDTITLLEKADNDLTIENLNFLLNKQLIKEDLLGLALKNEKLGEPFKRALEKRKGNS
ncbi:MAG: hypothetical protein OIF32_11040, partial [Campylobacterales bacterium]|nr:hypothetical protein [Campylobacterales bacterium]